MNIAQKIVLVLGLSVIATMFYAPYKVERRNIEYYRAFERKVWGKDAEPSRRSFYYNAPEGDWIWKVKKITMYEWVEFHIIFTPPQSQNLDKETVRDNSKFQIITFKRQDFNLQLTMIAGEIILVAILFFVFKTRKSSSLQS